MAQEHKSTRAQEHKVRNANEILRENLASVRTTTEWAEKLGYLKTNQFALHYRKQFGLNCKEAMIKIRLKIATALLENEPDLKCYEVAVKIGLPDELALYKYFMRHIGKPPSYIREKRVEKMDREKR